MPKTNNSNEGAVIDLTSSPTSQSQSMPVNGSMNFSLNRDSNFQPRQGARKLVIKNLRKTPRVSPEEYARSIWIQLDEAITAIFAGTKVPQSLEELYRGVENVCRQDGAADLFEKMRSRCREHVQTTLKAPLVEKAATGRSNVEMLQLVHAAWMAWNRQLLTIRSIFFYMDRAYLLSSRTEPTINEMGISLFRTHIFSERHLQKNVLQGMCDLVDFDRKQLRDLMDPTLLRHSITMVHEMLIYTSEFEPKFVRSSELYYNEWADEQTLSLDLASYVGACEKLMDGEMARCELFNLDASTRRELQAMLEEALIKRKVGKLTASADLIKLLDEDAVESMEKIYKLLQRVRQQSRLKSAWETYIRERGSAIVGDEEREGELVVRLLALKAKLDLFWRTAFHKHEELGHLLRESFATFINERKRTSTGRAHNSKTGEMIAKYVDMILRGGVKAIPPSLSGVGDSKRPPSALSALSSGRAFGAEDEDLEAARGDEDSEITQQLDQVLDLFRFIEGKDVFEAFYKKDLARRLLMARSASADAERNMLTRLKTECGAGFTHNLEQMFKDVDLAREEMASYKSMKADRGHSDVLDLNVNVLSASAWPSYPDVHVNVPPEIGRVIDEYDGHYKSKHTGRRLTWKHSLAHCVVKAKFPKGNKELVVSSFQAIVMVLFNGLADDGWLTYGEIQATTGLSEVELNRTLQSLACAKYRVLTKSPKGRDITPATDRFAINLSFHDAKYRIKINQIQLKETKEEIKATHEDINRDRQYETQAAIVRIMKSRKRVTHNELVSETIELTKKRGHMDVGEIKQQITKLIEKDYIERDLEAEGQVYAYLV
ncbi:MAG: hypothetical protein M1817_005734 [Caeruleum heppii]|nr:MAG: hypothetical protein M1817_005734 [Caeruleum heppii]